MDARNVTFQDNAGAIPIRSASQDAAGASVGAIGAIETRIGAIGVAANVEDMDAAPEPCVPEATSFDSFGDELHPSVVAALDFLSNDGPSLRTPVNTIMARGNEDDDESIEDQDQDFQFGRF